MMIMNSRVRSTEELLAELEEKYLSRDARGRRISRREILRSSAGTAVASAVGIGGLLELLANREAIAAGMVLAVVGVTRERMPLSETPHRHTFSVRFQVTSVTPSSIIGNVSGRTEAVISTSSTREDQHFHIIQMGNASLEQLLLSGPEGNEAGGHVHQVSIE
jgi:hypothetical protein